MADETIVLGEGTVFPLNGILSIPDEGEGVFPAVVLVHGSGPSNMDETIGVNSPFKDIAEGLTKRGIAVLRYDKRTLVHGKEMVKNPELSVKEETVEDAVLAADFLRNHERIDANSIYIIGHSLGGMLAPRIDKEGGDFAGIIILAGSPRKLEEIMLDQNQDVLQSLNRFLQWIAKKQVASFAAKLSNIYNLSDEEAKSTKILGKHVNAYYFKEMGEHPSPRYLKELTKPIYIMQGEKDFQVSIEKDFNGYKELLGDAPNVTYKTYPNLNHLFMPSVYGEILKAKKEYKVPQHVDNQVIQDIAEWILFR